MDKNWRPGKWEQIKAELLDGWDGTERNLGCLVEDTASAIVEAAALEGKKELAKKIAVELDVEAMSCDTGEKQILVIDIILRLREKGLL